MQIAISLKSKMANSVSGVKPALPPGV